MQRRTIDIGLIDSAGLGPSLVFVDFDYTMLAGNSTELFIASSRPSLVVALIEFVIRRCVPWRLSGLRNWVRLRDYVCCLAIITLCPGSIARWRGLAPALFERHFSREMAEALRPVALGQVAIITFGLEFVVKALLRDSAWSSVPLIATPTIAAPSHFTRGKRVLATHYAGAATVAAATFVTDSLDDHDLLMAVKAGILIAPQGAPFEAAELLYLPLRYTASAKYTRSYVVDQLVLVELALLLISNSRYFEQLLENIVFISLLFLSVMCIYEIGYFENDTEAARHERRPVLKDAVARFRLYPIVPGAWVWAVLTGALGNVFACMVLQAPYSELFFRLPAWIAGLVVLRLVFHVYNKPDLRVRLHIYPILQLLKFLAVMMVATATPIGAVAIFGQVATMWAIYLTYRHGGRTKDIEREWLRAILIAIGLGLLLTTSAGNGVGWQFQLTAIGIWTVARLGKARILELVRRRPKA